jgi:hypothetical protein
MVRRCSFLGSILKGTQPAVSFPRTFSSPVRGLVTHNEEHRCLFGCAGRAPFRKVRDEKEKAKNQCGYRVSYAVLAQRVPLRWLAFDWIYGHFA